MPVVWKWAEGPDGFKLPWAELNGARPGPTWLFTAGVHGDEYEGPEAVRRAVAELIAGDFAGRVLALPVSNPMAYARGLRCTPEDQGNLNRFFPGDPRGTFTARWADWLWRNFMARADRIVDLHAGGATWEFDSLAGHYTDEDEPLAAVFGLILWRVPDIPGVLSREFRRLRGPAVGVELGCGGVRHEALTGLAHRALVRLARGETSSAPGPVYLSHNVFSPAEGEWTPACRLRQTLRAGDLLGHVTDWTSSSTREIRSPVAGQVLAVRRLVSLQSGDLMAMMGEPVRS
ncbi:MAG: succinylglutamate desuccinylase/aspartoacylase family protein [Planctomycetes bacterium]|nr:succinylglutamate desuccinylase/aspartoacylase family protein [Planctomycetota bacterium]